jgi:DNA-binding response OmpR family regulator
VSGFADQTLEQDVLDTNDAFLAKPFLPRELARTIRELFREPEVLYTSGGHSPVILSLFVI